MEIRTIRIEEFDLTLMEMRIMNRTRALKIECSMKVNGQLQPVVVRLNDGRYQLIDGFKRLYAAEILLIDELECLVLEVSLEQAKILLMTYNRSGQGLLFWEEASILQDLRNNHGMDQKQLAGLTGRSRSWISRRLSMMERIDPEVVMDIRLGELSGSHGRALMKLPRGKQGSVADAILSWRLSTRQSDQLVQAWIEADEERRERLLEDPLIEIEQECDERYVYSYDGRLSCFGNELKLCIGEIISSINGSIRRLTDQRIEQLSESETVILRPFLQGALECCRKFTRTDLKLPHQNQIQEHEE